MSNESNSSGAANQWVFHNGQLVENPIESHHHVSPKHVYVGVFAALLVLTGITYLVSYADLGAASLPVAMVVASMKASLVIAFFMHLKYEDRVFAFLFGTCLVFVAIFFSFTLYDMNNSGYVNEITGTSFKRGVDDAAEVANMPPPKKDDHGGH
jgi:cytochrome c oxidase subunit 4